MDNTKSNPDFVGLVPRFRWGHILPTKSDFHRGTGYQFYRLVPLDIMEISVGLGITDYTHEGVLEASANFWNCVRRLKEERIDHLVLAGAPISAQLGRARILELIDQAEQELGVPADAPLEAVVASMKHLDLTRLAIASRWDDELNTALLKYFDSTGIEIVGITRRGQWAKEAFGMSFEKGLEMALEVGREAAGYKDAQAVYVAGGASMSIHVLPTLEAEYGIPYFTNLSAELWHGLVEPGVISPISGWGRLLSTP